MVLNKVFEESFTEKMRDWSEDRRIPGSCLRPHRQAGKFEGVNVSNACV